MTAREWSQRALVAAAWLVCTAAPAFAQSDAGSLRVFVTDTTAAALPGADVTVTDAATNVSQSQPANTDGYAVFSPLRRGTYVVKVTLEGFGTVTVRDVGVDVQQARLVRVTMQMATLQEAVEVTAAAAPIQSEQGSLGQVIKGAVARELPLAARRYSDLALLTPGATASTLDTTIRGPGWFTINGTYHTQNNFILDGFDNNQGTTNMQSLSSQVVQPSPDALSEFKVQTNSFSAEFGRSAGAVVNVSLKSGTNEMHGSAWYYNRDSALAATSWRAKTTNQPKDNLKWNQFGGTFGGPVVHNKVFYFGHYEGFQSDRTTPFLTQVPTVAQRNGVFPFPITDPLTGQPFPNNTIPQDRINPLGQTLANLYPAPTQAGRVVTGGRTVENFSVTRPSTEDTHKFDIRNDYALTEKDRAFVRYSFLQQDIFRDAIFEPPVDDGAQANGRQYNRNQSAGVSWTRIFGSKVVNEARVGYNRTYATFAHASEGGLTGTDLGFLGIPPSMEAVGGLPRVVVTNYNDIGTGSWRPQYQLPQSWQFLDVTTISQGNHAVKVGFEFRRKHNQFVDIPRRNPQFDFTGRFTGDAVADMLLGYVDAFRENNFFVAHQLQQAFAGFVQDDWKLAPNFTLNVGLRYEYSTPYWALDPTPNVNFDPSTGWIQQATDEDRYLVTTDKNNWAPRLGFAYQVKPDHLVLRGGYGVFYGGEDFNGSNGNLVLNPPNLLSPTLNSVGNRTPAMIVTDPIPAQLVNTFNPADSVRTSLNARASDQKAMTLQQWNVAMEILLAPIQATVEVAYVGNRGRNLPGVYAANQVPFGVDGSVAANRPYPQWLGISMYETVARSQYDGLQVKFERRFAKGWYNLTSYSYGRAFSEAGGFGATNTPQVYNDWAAEWAPDSQTPRHRLSIANIYELPIGRDRAIGANMGRVTNFLLGGWQVSTLFTWQTGTPVDVTLATNGIDPATGRAYSFLNRNGGALRPNLVGTPNTGVDPKDDRFGYLDPAGYQIQTLNTAGNAPRNSAWGPRYANLDLSLVKRFRVDAQRYFDFRVEAFNVLNATRFKLPNGVYGGTTFGIISDAYDPRVMQIALRFAF